MIRNKFSIINKQLGFCLRGHTQEAILDNLMLRGNNLYFSKMMCLLGFIFWNMGLFAQDGHCDIIVAQDGSGDFISISKAIGSLPMYNYERVVIFIKNGIYDEKFKIECDYVTLVGESRENTIIRKSIVREDWIKSPDHIGPAVINIFADDVIIKNLTVENSQPEIGPHAFAVYGTGTRTIIDNCICLSKGGDTVSLWNYKQGMYYHKDSHFEGAVDFVCPRGWCYIKNSSFYEHKETAAIWHAAVLDSNQKFVLVNCTFDGVKGYNLGRHHYEAQFYLLNCNFSETMKDKPIEHFVYKDRPEKNRPYFYGNRYYFYNCHREGGDYSWFANNLNEWPGGLGPEHIDADWTFDGLWNPEDSSALALNGFKIKNQSLYLYFDEQVSKRGNLVLQTKSRKLLTFKEGIGRDILRFSVPEGVTPNDIRELRLVEGEVYGIKARLLDKKLPKKITLQQNSF